ncbi:nuclear protein UL3 [Testudinid alphaherpesvirus 3]|uniref:Nuclear protein UL3 n=1 Tax=Testudinid alphaherpesvirus 3 TaxID=2560801 RepID=A0A0K1R189_9ALPH|nr:nuclear protein UL3 [Testudinid alphaherpesvirus 3]AIU39292.1 nuclear protein UL3 [Testudinid alphaherpesvirus 3]AIU39402.1 nuclear protein UL3 [Testudinid alphaherpesvirus 3]AKI81678.1 nuclear protein UL3 [Testudinid alphaherpesvirus 3]AKI81726.1 nuclear protein UL3 [Testudinid alphaherpesvirus 3]AKI81781.1 nuclear protein UL3 [Testudinid alphaherpesvirus 3]
MSYIPSVVSLLAQGLNNPGFEADSDTADEPSQTIEDGKRVVYKSKFPTSTDEMVNNPTYYMYDTMFVISSTDELGRRQITDTIRKEIKKALFHLNIACTKTSSFSCEGKRKHRNKTTVNKCLQMSIFCKREHAHRVRELLTTLIESRKPRKYFTCTRDGDTKPGVPIFFSEFFAKDPVYLHEDNIVRTSEEES